MPCALLAHGEVWRAQVLGGSGGAEVAVGQVVLWEPIPSSLHRHWTCTTLPWAEVSW